MKQRLARTLFNMGDLVARHRNYDGSLWQRFVYAVMCRLPNWSHALQGDGPGPWRKA